MNYTNFQVSTIYFVSLFINFFPFQDIKNLKY